MDNKIIFFFLLVCIFFAPASKAQGVNLYNRLGVGLSYQLATPMPAISFKMQKSDTIALGLLGTIRMNKENGGYGAGFKIYRIFFEEPNLRFYLAGLLAILNRKMNAVTETGQQVDGTFGTEFHFTGLQSLGFSFEAGLSLVRFGSNTTVEVAGYHIVRSAVHFYF